MKNSATSRFTNHLKNIIFNAVHIAFTLRQPLEPWHLLFSLQKQQGSIGSEMLSKINLNPKHFKSLISSNKIKSPTPEKIYPKIDKVNISEPTKKVIEKAALLANQYQYKYIGTEHLLLALIEIKDEIIIKIIEQTKSKTTIQDLKTYLNHILKTTAKFPALKDSANLINPKKESGINVNILPLIAIELTNPKLQKNINPVIGRENEINRIVQILNRYAKNNPILLGDPGVGKTAIVEGLAKRIVEKKVPQLLLHKKIWMLDLGLLVAGAIWRGEFEARMKQVLEEVKHDPNIILFIDELHTIMGTGNASGGLDIANMLKPALARGEIRCIGATTLEEYNKYISNEGALERRFQPIIIKEPDKTEAYNILQGLKSNYENFHSVTISDDAIKNAVNLSHRYISDRFLPDKAIDLLDEACASANSQNTLSAELQEVQNLEEQISNLYEARLDAIANENFNKAIQYRDNMSDAIDRLTTLKQVINKMPKSLRIIDARDITSVVEQWGNIKINQTQDDNQTLLNLESKIQEKIIGQTEVAQEVADFLRLIQSNLIESEKPLGSMLFLGSNGVGKTEMAKLLANILYPGKQALLHLDMSEYSEGLNLSKLIGAPPGYVGYKEGGLLTDAIKKKPYSIILLDEIDKAHHEILNLLLQILEYGFCRDATGKKINFRNTIIIMTSNVGSQGLNPLDQIGFLEGSSANPTALITDQIKNSMLKEIKKTLTPSILDRLDKIFFFKNLQLEDMENIVNLKVNEMNAKIIDKNINLILEEEAKKFIAKMCYNSKEGARSVRKHIQTIIETPLVYGVLTKTFQPNDNLNIKLVDEKIKLIKI